MDGVAIAINGSRYSHRAIEINYFKVVFRNGNKITNVLTYGLFENI